MLVAIDQLAGCAVPACALEPLVLAARVRDYEPSYLDELTASGEVVWAGHAALPGADGWVSLHLADQAPLTLPEPQPFEHARAPPGGARRARPGRRLVLPAARRRASGRTNDAALSAALWDLVWAGRVSNDTLAPLRALTRAGHAEPPQPAPAAAGPHVVHDRRPRRMPARTGPPETAGRWALLPEIDTDPTRRAHAAAERLLDRHGVVTRGAVVSERVPGGFAAVYKVLSAFEESGRCRRGYFVDGLGAAQFGTAGAIDRLRTFAEVSARTPAGRQADRGRAGRDRPGQPVRRGAAVAGPGRRRFRRRPGEAAAGHRPGRKAGALVVLVDGALTLYVERGGRTLLTWTDEPRAARGRRPTSLATPPAAGRSAG